MVPSPESAKPTPLVGKRTTRRPIITVAKTWFCRCHYLILILTFTYNGALHYFTLDPTKEIRNVQNDSAALIKALEEFRLRKSEEITFVRNAATLSAAASLAIFSWPPVETTPWPAKLFWHWGLILSIFSLISSVQSRLLAEFPLPKCSGSDQAAVHVLDLVLRSEYSPNSGLRERSIALLWMWQCPTMLMSYSWLFFLVGYVIHILRPLTSLGHELTPAISIVTATGCLLVAVNFVYCAILSRDALLKARKKKQEHAV
ncbi:hypothetical protein F5Y18DRAFT_378192 [Xylariaceae sp. FL1019]|nr:hypothetical protein F5Y18DRAFT_378192 [Xylariaceae sp. FL1019]